ncbi:VOC family protein [Candidatus Daviesbacteria bacterium]|nr:VOC family protein [Candidatus Daviesbacteria bacterium]
MDPVVHFEMPAKDKKRVAKFYSSVFGWQMNQLGQDMGNYLLANTTETDKNGMPKKPGGINGGFWEYQEGQGDQIPHIVISVDNLKESMKNVKEAGGEILGETMNIPGIGEFVMFKDSEGNSVGMLQPAPM